MRRALTPADVRGKRIGPRGQVRAAPRRGRPVARPTPPLPAAVRAGTGDHGASWVALPLAVPLTANGSHGHWSKTAAVRRRVRAVVLAACQRHLAPCPDAVGWVLILTRIAPRRGDSDNATAALKPARDAVAAWLGRDDGDPTLRWVVRQAVGPAGLRIDARPVVAGGYLAWRCGAARVIETARGLLASDAHGVVALEDRRVAIANAIDALAALAALEPEVAR